MPAYLAEEQKTTIEPAVSDMLAGFLF